MPIEPNYMRIRELFADRVFNIPIYQRHYSWGKQQRKDLFNDIEKVLQYVDQEHFMATIVCYNTGVSEQIVATEYHVYDIVDGQQRITSIVLIMKAIALHIAENQEVDNQDAGADIVLVELQEYLVKGDGVLLLLQSNNDHNNLFNQFIRQGRIPDEDALVTHADKKIFEGINESRSFVADWMGKYNDIVQLWNIVKNKLGFVVFDVADQGEVYRDFEVLNSRGLQVDWLDKCKSSLMGLAYELAENPQAAGIFLNQLYQIWGNIYRSLAQYDLPGDEILRITATLYTGADAGKLKSSSLSLTSLTALCQNPNDCADVSNKILEVTRQLGQVNADPLPSTRILQARMLAVSIKLSQLTEEEQQNALDVWRRITFRIYGIFGKDARSKVGDYVRLAIQIISNNIGFQDVINNINAIGQEFPVNMAVQNLKNNSVYNNSHKEDIRYLLWRYEEYLARCENADVDGELRAQVWAAGPARTIEHIMPQNPEEDGPWQDVVDGINNNNDYELDVITHCIGNLLLLPPARNIEAGNKGFQDKQEVYERAGGLRIIMKVLDNHNWGVDEIIDRQTEILEWVETEWN